MSTGSELGDCDRLSLGEQLGEQLGDVGRLGRRQLAREQLRISSRCCACSSNSTVSLA